jgi:hypothetical protein
MYFIVELIFIAFGGLIVFTVLYHLWPYIFGLLAIIGAIQVFTALSRVRFRKQNNHYHHANRN